MKYIDYIQIAKARCDLLVGPKCSTIRHKTVSSLSDEVFTPEISLALILLMLTIADIQDGVTYVQPRRSTLTRNVLVEKNTGLSLLCWDHA